LANLDLDAAVAARAFVQGLEGDETSELLLAAAALRDHGVYALFHCCARMGCLHLARGCLTFLRSNGFAVDPCCAGDACNEVEEHIATDLAATFRARRLLLRFFDYAYLHACDRAAQLEGAAAAATAVEPALAD